MRLSILGSSGGVGGNLRTTCLLLDEDTLIDCGTGAGDLSLQEMIAVERVFLTHSHLDHVALLPMLADSAGNFRAESLKVHALAETISILKSHVFNGQLWPDYTVQPSPEHPYILFEEIGTGQTIALQGKRITALPARHSVPAAGFLIDSGKASFAFSGDSTFCEAFWDKLNEIENLRYVMVEATFLDSAGERAKTSGHMTPSLLKRAFGMLRRPAELLITHMEAGREDETMREILSLCPEFSPRAVRPGEIFEF